MLTGIRSVSVCAVIWEGEGVFGTWVGLKVLCGFGHDVQHRSGGDVHLLWSNKKNNISDKKEQRECRNISSCLFCSWILR